jgi:DNA polymerase I-like protein with 3'-5' exonuclease and polymerase domains
MFTVISAIGAPDRRAWLGKTQYELCSSIEQLYDYVQPECHADGFLGADWETTSLNHYDGSLRPVGLSLSRATGSGLYYPIGHSIEPEANLPLRELNKALQVIDSSGCRTGWYNYRYDGEVCEQHLDGWTPPHYEDPMIGVHLWDSNLKQLGLKETVKLIFGVDLIEYDELMQTATGAYLTFDQIAPIQAVPYACGDADFTRRLWFHPDLVKAREEQAFIYRIERLLVDAVRPAIRAGLYLDLDRFYEIGRELGGATSGRIGDCQKAIFEMAGCEFDLASSQQIGKILVEKLGVPIVERTPKSQQVETGKDVLARYADKYPICKQIVLLRELTALKTSYNDKLIAAARTSRLARFSLNTMGAPTGRMSSGGGDAASGLVPLNVMSTPEPEKNPEKPNMRSGFVANDYTDTSIKLPPEYPLPEREWVIVSVDYSQIEMRVVANLSKEPAWIKAFSEGIDIHITNARLAYGDMTIPEDDKERRAKGKALALDTPILTPAGWRLIRDIEIGDWVFGAHGRPVRVHTVSEVFEGHPCYRVSLGDGSSVVADAEHQWRVRSRRGWETLTTRQMVERGVRFGARQESRFALPAPAPLTGFQSEGLLLDPYLLGTWLGDGATAWATISTADDEILEAWRRHGFVATHLGQYDYALRRQIPFDRSQSVLTRLRLLGVQGRKHIPLAYLLASAEDRLALLQGLMDTDGTCAATGTAIFYSTNQDLAEGVMFLVRSLGGRASWWLKPTSARPCFCVAIRGPFQLFRLSRKAARWVPRDPGSRTIDAIEPVASVPTCCIGVDDPEHLFLAGEGLLATHNTMGFAVLFQAGPETVAAHGGILLEAAEKLIATFFANTPSLNKWIESTKLYAEGNKHVKTYFGRVRRLAEYFTPTSSRSMKERGKREGVNMPVQGTAADIFKMAIIKTAKAIKERWPGKVHHALFVHDEIVFRVHRTVLREFLAEYPQYMEFPVKGWQVPLKTDAGIGWDWGTLYAPEDKTKNGVTKPGWFTLYGPKEVTTA